MNCPALLENHGDDGAPERYEGHILNWYDTKTLEPLLPKYVSSVDSGNLIASLWAFPQGCRRSSARRW